MRRVLIQEAAPGMVLAKPVTTSSGMVILAAGLMLDEAVIARLEGLGKQAVYIEGSAMGEGTLSLEALEQQLDHRFRKSMNDPQQLTIRDAIRRHLRAREQATR